jgi:hypothetical protein
MPLTVLPSANRRGQLILHRNCQKAVRLDGTFQNKNALSMTDPERA